MGNFIEWGALANVVLVSIVVGAGLPALFALGVRALDGPGSHDGSGMRRPKRLVLATLCFAVVVMSIVGAIAYIAAGGH